MSKPYDEKLNPTQVGVFDIPEHIYHKIKAFNSSSLKILAGRTPAHLDAYRRGLSKPITAQKQALFNMGTAIDLAIFEPERFASEVVTTPTGKGWSKNSKKYQEWASGLPAGAIILSADQGQRVKNTARMIYKKKSTRSLLKTGWAQKAVFWRHPEFGFWCKARVDWLTEEEGTPVVVDLKSTGDAGLGQWGFQRTVWNLKYYWQAAWYLDGLTIATGLAHTKWKWIVGETYPPHECRVFVAGQVELDEARDQIHGHCRRYAECLEKDEWPGYPDDEVQLGDKREFDPYDPMGDDIPW